MQKTQLQQKQTPRIIPRRLLGLLVALFFFFILLTSVIGLVEKHSSINERIDELYAEQLELRAKEEQLKALNMELETPEGREYALRNKYNLVRPGEEMIIITKIEDPKSGIDSRPRVVRWWSSILEGLGLKKE